MRIVLDATAVNPSGRHQPYDCTGRRALLQIGGEPGRRRWRVVDESDSVLLDWSWSWRPEHGRWDGLHDVTVLDCAGLSVLRAGEAESAALLVAQAAMSGAICCWPAPPASVAELLGPETVELLTTPLPAPTVACGGRPPHPRSHLRREPPPPAISAMVDALDWDVRGVRQRRAALREHAAGFEGRLPTVSVVLATRRPDRLPHAIAQVRAQSYPDLELIVAGSVFPTRLGDSALSDAVDQVVTVPPDAPLDVLLARATECASGDLVTRFDDADSYGPEHVWDLVLARHYADATLVGKPDEFVYLEKLASTIRRSGCRSEHYSHWVAGGTMLVGRAELTSVGNWPSTPVNGSVERALLDRIAASGGRIYRTHGLGYLYHRHAFGHTWNPDLGYFLGRSGAHWTGMLRHPEFSAG